MLMHYCDHNDNNVLVEIDRDKYLEFLRTKTGQELVDAVDGSIIVVDDNPRRAALEKADAYFPYKIIAEGFLEATDLHLLGRILGKTDDVLRTEIQYRLEVIEEDILFLAAEIQNKLGLPDTGKDADQHKIGIMILDRIKHKLTHGEYVKTTLEDYRKCVR